MREKCGLEDNVCMKMGFKYLRILRKRVRAAY